MQLRNAGGITGLRVVAVMAVAVIAAIVGGGVLPASAAPHTAWTSGKAGSARFGEIGDHLYLCDHAGDNHGVGVSVVYFHENGDKQDDWYWNGGGKDDCRDIKLDVKEGTNIGYYVCLADHTKKGGKKPVPIWNTCSANMIVTNDNRW